MNDTVAYVSTFYSKEGSERLLEYELQRLVSFTSRERSCVSCELFQPHKDKTIFVVRSVWSNHDVWLTRGGWEKHPAGTGMMDLCLLRPVKVMAMKEVA